MSPELVRALLLSSLAFSPLTVIALGITWLFGVTIPEKWVSRLSVLSTTLSALATVSGTIIGVAEGVFPLEAGPWEWFRVADYTFNLTFRWDLVSLVMALSATLISALVVGFSVAYLHREAGHFRYFLLMLIFSGAMQWLVVSGSYDQLFLGWELVGITSVLLISFFHDRAQPVLSAIRVLITYRVCDLGLLVGAVLMHQYAHSTQFGHIHSESLSTTQATVLALLMLLAASGKAAQLPFGTWLPKAMEGPTPSSAVFYGALSVHAGIYLLIRAEPFFEASTVASIAAIAVGGVTAVCAGMVARVQNDAKTSLAWASMAQLGLMVVEVGLHFPTIALIHLFGHASLRGVQMLKAPNLLFDSINIRKAMGLKTLDFNMSQPVGMGIYRVLRNGLYIDTFVERLITRPVVALGRVLERFGPASQWKPEPGPSPESLLDTLPTESRSHR